MLRITTEQTFTEDGKKYIEGFCLSTDTKPTTGIITGSSLVEVDTGNAFLFDEESSTWEEQ